MNKGNFITSDQAPDLFVGIRFREGKPEVVFPHGYNLSLDPKESRKDVFRLLAVLKRFTERTEGEKTTGEKGMISSFPLSSYQYVIHDFFEHGYYIENEVRYISSNKGKINWKKTIQQEQSHLDGNIIISLNFRVRTNKISEDNLLTQIHKYCVYHSLYRFGWLYLTTSYLPPEPPFKADSRLFINTLKNALNNTFNDSKRKLFQSMINILRHQDEETDIKNFSLGVYRFDSVWEKMIDFVFGEENKDVYFPHAKWHIIKNGKPYPSSALEPDTIMKHDGKVFVLDAKYYQYGVTENPADLPNTSSIQKQITYGKHIVEFIKEVPENNVFNAFIMPFNGKESEKVKFVSVGTADWEKYNTETNNYAYVLGVLLDTKWLISEYTKHNESEIEMLASFIESSLQSYRKLTE